MTDQCDIPERDCWWSEALKSSTRIGESSVESSFNILSRIPSGPAALDTLSDRWSLKTPFSVMLISGMSSS